MDDIADLCKQFFELNSADFLRIDHHDTMIAVVYKVIQPTEKPLILKICSREEDYHRELFFLNSLTGYLPVPQVQGSMEPVDAHPGAILMDYIEGALLNESDWSHELAFDIGSKLALLHSKRADNYGDSIKKENLTINPLEYFQDKFFEELEECSNHLPKEDITSCKHYFDSNQNLFDSVDGPCMVHRDFRPGNIIVRDGKLMAVIDWASGRFGFTEQDFCSMEHRKWPKNSEYKKSLQEGYSSIRNLPDFYRIMPLLRLGKALAVIGFTVQSGTWNGRNREIYQYYRQFLDRFLLGIGS